MNNTLNAKERHYIGQVKQLPCSVCDEPGPSEAHHIEQSLQYTCIALCPDCHRGSFAGWHGQKRAWTARKMTQLDALNITIKRMLG